MIRRIRATNIAAAQIRGQMVSTFVDIGKSDGAPRLAGIVEGTVMAYADLYGPREATELCYRLGDTGCKITMGAGFGRSVAVEAAAETSDEPERQAKERLTEEAARKLVSRIFSWPVFTVYFVLGMAAKIALDALVRAL